MGTTKITDRSQGRRAWDENCREARSRHTIHSGVGWEATEAKTEIEGIVLSEEKSRKKLILTKESG